MIYIDSKALTDVQNKTYFYLFNSNGILVHDTIMPADNLKTTTTQLLTKNLFEGQYRLITFSNVNRMAVPSATRGNTKIEDINFNSQSIQAHDSLRYHSSEHILERDKPITANIEINPCFYHTTITVVGLELLSKPLVNPVFKLFNLPSTIDADGLPKNVTPIEIIPELVEKEDKSMRSEKFMVLRFNDLSETTFQIFDNDKHIQTTVLRPSEFIISPMQTNVDIRVEFQPQRATITVNDWFAGSVDFFGMGE